MSTVCIVSTRLTRIEVSKPFKHVLRFPLILLDLTFFGVGGAAGEWCLIQRGFMYYANGWTTFHAFLSYFVVWSMLHILLNKVTPPETTV